MAVSKVVALAVGSVLVKVGLVAVRKVVALAVVSVLVKVRLVAVGKVVLVAGRGDTAYMRQRCNYNNGAPEYLQCRVRCGFGNNLTRYGAVRCAI